MKDRQQCAEYDIIMKHDVDEYFNNNSNSYDYQLHCNSFLISISFVLEEEKHPRYEIEEMHFGKQGAFI
jgi:hypothetical protein